MPCLLHRLVGYLLVVVGVIVATATGRCSDSPPADFAEDERLLKDAKIATDGPALLEFIRKRIRSAAEVERIDSLIERLGDEDFKEREQASTDLKAIGPASLPALRLARKARDAEIRRRAARIIEVIQSGTMSRQLCAAAHLLQDRRPDGAVRVLIDYLPFSEDSEVGEEVLGTLTSLGVQAGKVDPALVATLQSKASAQRAAGAMLLGWAGTPEQRLAVKELLHDPDVMVRFRAAQGLLAGGDKAAVPTLISLLQGVPLDLTQCAEDLLRCAAGSLAPSITLEESETGRKRCADAWRDWSRSNLEKLDLTKRDVSLPASFVNTRAREVARRWIDSLVKRDLNTWMKTSDFPFVIMDQAFNKREELDRLFDDFAATGNPEMMKTTFAVKDVVSVEQYLKSGMTSSRDPLIAFFPGRAFL